MISKLAFLYPGQGSQYVGMGKDLYDNFQVAREIYHLTNKLLGFDLTAVCFEGPEEELKQTRVTQPAIFVHSVIMTQILVEQKILPQVAAGHSLGEYSALVAAGAVGFEHGLFLVKERGELMQRAGEQQPGTMAAIVGLSIEDVEEICRQASATGVVTAANFNSPQQIAISGSHDAIARASELAQERGALKVIPLMVSGAFHSPLMAYAQEKMKTILRDIPIQDARFPVYANVTAQPVRSATQIRELLHQQLTHPVRWVETIENMIADGVTEFYEVGPGNVLSGLVRRINRNFSVQTKGKVKDISYEQ